MSGQHTSQTTFETGFEKAAGARHDDVAFRRKY
jgi:hypothetical protein